MPRRPVRDITAKDLESPGKLLDAYGKAGGFSARGLAKAADILEAMWKDKGATVFLSFPADIIATGSRGLIYELVRRNLADVLITTCGMLDHDLARASKDYFEGEWLEDDRVLAKKHIYRLGNVVIPQANYGGIIEREMRKILEGQWKKGVRRLSTKDLVWAIGAYLGPKKGKGSICRAAFETQTPVFVPGITDGAVGSQMWLFWQDHRDLFLDLFKDEQDLADLVFTARRTHAVILGGGISKHHTIWWNQFRGGLDSAIYLTTAVEWDGSLSGARLREAVSWGKIKPDAQEVTVEGDVTSLLPFLVGGVLERLGDFRRERARV
jgi:deoxyhypusine synthase